MSTARTADGVRVAYEDRGDGEPALLFLPGWCTDREVFQGVPERLSRRHRVLVPEWRGHGESERPAKDFGNAELVRDADAVIAAVGPDRIVPVALSHAGWVAIELRRCYGARVTGIVLLDWIVFEPPVLFLDALKWLQSRDRSRQTVEALFGLWLHDVGDPKLTRFVREGMASYPREMWARAAREIAAAYAAAGTPLKALAALEPPPPVLHLYGQPRDPAYLAAQEQFAQAHPWFRVQRLNARSHFPTFEVPDEIVAAIEAFLADTTAGR
jgi:pimeloyl-ACP methyl ester carboxylesterase